MKMMGYQNQVLRIDLTGTRLLLWSRSAWILQRKYVGSKGLAIRYMYEELKPGIDPLGPDNKLFLTDRPAYREHRYLVPASCLLQPSRLPPVL